MESKLWVRADEAAILHIAALTQPSATLFHSFGTGEGEILQVFSLVHSKLGRECPNGGREPACDSKPGSALVSSQCPYRRAPALIPPSARAPSQPLE
jgi:hypothetical protein